MILTICILVSIVYGAILLCLTYYEIVDLNDIERHFGITGSKLVLGPAVPLLLFINFYYWNFINVESNKKCNP